MKPIVGYYQVSSDKQGRSGLGLEAQRETVTRFAEANGSRSSPMRLRSRPAKGPTRSIVGRG
jgi:DNA invertase Pin-like site-specific DNA recombinase